MDYAQKLEIMAAAITAETAMNMDANLEKGVLDGLRRIEEMEKKEKESVKRLDHQTIQKISGNKVKQDLRFKTGNFVWRVRFNIPLDPHTVNKDTMYVTNSQNQKLRSYIRYDTKNEIIEVEPLEPYSTNEYYFLTITKNVKSRGGQSLKEPVQIKFKL